MASARYTLNITPDPPEETREMTRREKTSNYWHYHKWYYLTGAIVLVMAGMFIYEIVTQVKPDYQLALLSTRSLPPAVTETLEQQLSLLADDRNGDGTTKVAVVEYTVQTAAQSSGSGDVAAAGAANAPVTGDPYQQMAGMTKLAADMQLGESMLFLTNDPEAYQEQMGMFAYNDGSVPAEDATPDWARMGVKWSRCPTLSRLPLGKVEMFDGSEGPEVQALLQDYVLVRRTVQGTQLEKKEKTAAYAEAAGELFAQWTEQ